MTGYKVEKEKQNPINWSLTLNFKKGREQRDVIASYFIREYPAMSFEVGVVNYCCSVSENYFIHIDDSVWGHNLEDIGKFMSDNLESRFNE